MQVSGRSELSLMAAYLANPQVRVPAGKLVVPDKDAAKEIYSILLKNKVLLRTLDHLCNSRVDPSKRSILDGFVTEHKPFSEAIEFASRLRRELLELTSTFQRDNLELFFIKSFSSLPLDSDNFDILVRDEDVAKARENLAHLGLVEIVWKREPHKYLFRRVKDGESYFAVHLHTRVAWEGYEFVDVDDLWEERRQVNVGRFSVCMPSANHHLLVTLAHAFFENHNFKLGDLGSVLESVGEVDWQYVVNRVTSDGWSKPFQALLLLSNHISDTLFGRNMFPNEGLVHVNTSESPLATRFIREYNRRGLPVEISLALATRHYIKKIFSSPDMSLYEKMGATVSLLSRGVKRRAPLTRTRAKHPPFLVCFSGVDAAGKTTHAQSLWNKLQEKDMGVKYVWSRGFGHSFEPLLYFFRRILGVNPKDSYTHERRRATLFRHDPLRKLWAHLILTDHVMQVMRKVTIPLALGNIVICDRYIQDTLVDARCELGVRVGRLVEKLTERLVPKPNVILFLDASAEEIAKRRKHVNLEEVRRKRLSYLRGYGLAHCLEEKIATVDVSEPLSQNKKKIVDIVLKNYYSLQK